MKKDEVGEVAMAGPITKQVTCKIAKLDLPISPVLLESIERGQEMMRRQAKLDQKLAAVILDREMIRRRKVKDPLDAR